MNNLRASATESVIRKSCANPGLESAEERPLAQIARKLRENELLSALIVRGFRALQRVGISITPSHFYWPVPDLAELESHPWPHCAASVSFDLRLQAQLEFLQKITEQYGDEWLFADQPRGPSDFHYNNGFFEIVDAEVAYSFVRHYKPARIIEIGGGFSTRIMRAALQANLEQDGVRGGLTSIDPHSDRLPSNGSSDLLTFVPKRVQDVDLELFGVLKRNDILFIDSSHVVRIGSDVVREYLEILPRLESGVVVHIHDIFLPWDYPREAVLHNLSFWSEQYLLQAFLSFNSSFEVLWASSAMQGYHSAALEEAFPRWKTSYRNMPKAKRRFVPTPDHEKVWPSSFWMRRL